jgi:hypothetical protein
MEKQQKEAKKKRQQAKRMAASLGATKVANIHLDKYTNELK